MTRKPIITALRKIRGRINQVITQTAMYGNVNILRGKCSECNCLSLVVDGKHLCCGSNADDIKRDPKRMSIPVYKRSRMAAGTRRSILISQDNKCYWCDRSFGSYVDGKILNPVYDHVDPFVHSQNNNTENMVASCRFCNAWKSDRIFHSEDEARVYLFNKWAEKTKK